MTPPLPRLTSGEYVNASKVVGINTHDNNTTVIVIYENASDSLICTPGDETIWQARDRIGSEINRIRATT